MDKSLILDIEIWKLLSRTKDLIDIAHGNEVKQYKITFREATTLFYLDSIGNKATPSQLARMMVRKPNTVVYILTRMEKKGLVKQTKDATRKNLVRVKIMAKGKKALGNFQRMESINEIMGVLSEEEQGTLKLLLQKLCQKANRHNNGHSLDTNSKV